MVDAPEPDDGWRRRAEHEDTKTRGGDDEDADKGNDHGVDVEDGGRQEVREILS